MEALGKFLERHAAEVEVAARLRDGEAWLLKQHGELGALLHCAGNMLQLVETFPDGIGR